jgi:hypothetical protein
VISKVAREKCPLNSEVRIKCVTAAVRIREQERDKRNCKKGLNSKLNICTKGG